MTELEQAIARALASVARYRAGRTDLIPDIDLRTLTDAAERVTKLEAELADEREMHAETHKAMQAFIADLDAWKAVALAERERCIAEIEDKAKLWTNDMRDAVSFIRALPAPTIADQS